MTANRTLSLSSKNLARLSMARPQFLGYRSRPLKIDSTSCRTEYGLHEQLD